VTTRIHVTNPSRYPRKDWAVWGSPAVSEHSYTRTPAGTYLNVGRVSVPANFSSQVDVEDSSPGPFILHPAVRIQMLAGGFKPWVSINGRVIDLEPELTLTVNDDRLVVSFWKDRTAEGIAELVVYLFKDSPILQWELAITGESLITSSQDLVVDFMLGTGPLALTWVYDGFDKLDSNGNPPASAANPIKKLRLPPKTGDAQGYVYRGVVIFYSGTPTQEEADSARAAMVAPLIGMTSWPEHGVWDKTADPAGNLADDSATLAGVNWEDPLAHPRFIQNKRPADSGEQAEVAVPWTHFADVTDTSSLNLYRKLCASYRNCLRPTWYFEADSNPIFARDHRDLVIWSEEIHFHSGVSRDRLRRTHTGSSASGWFGHDNQHQGWIFACENFLLTGSWLLHRKIAQIQQNWIAALTLPSTHPGWSTNDPGPGRDVGHFFRAIAQSLRVVWTEQLFQQACQRLIQVIYPAWRSRHTTGSIIKPYTIIGPDPRTGFPTQPSWAAWQDSIFVMGLSTFLQVTVGRLTPALRDILREMIEETGTSVVEHGFTPQGEQAVAYMPIPGNRPPADYYDPLQVTLATGTDFRHWDLSCVGIMERRGSPRAVQLKASHAGDSRPQYTGTLLP